MIEHEPALLELFNRLREAGLPLGLEEYHLLLQAVDAGFGDDRNALAQLCCTLWVKSEEEQLIFQEYFDQLIPESNLTHILPSTTDANRYQKSSSDDLEANDINIKKPKLVRFIPYVTIAAISALIIVVIYSLIRRPSEDNPGILTFSTIPLTNQFFVKENEKNAEIKIVRTGGNNGEVSATITVNETDDYQTATAGEDFDDTPILVTFSHGEMGVKPLYVPIFDDNDIEVNEKITLQLSETTGGVEIAGKGTATLVIVNDDLIYPQWLIIWWERCLIAIAGLLILLIVVRMRSMRKRIIASDDEDTEDRTNLPVAKLSPQVMQTLFDEIQVAKVIKQPESQIGETFPIITKDIPVTYRQMKQGWRYLRHLIREGVPTELDLEETIDQIGQQGFLLNPVLKPRRINKIELLLLIDQDGSMVPFHHLSQALINTASRGGRFNQVRVYYFHNCPSDYLYQDPYHLEAVPIEDCLSQLPKKRVVCLIFSDAGAARGQFSSKRRRRTKFFLKELQQYVHHIAWLNPFPRERWEYTTAEEIAKLVPMFEVNRQELYQAIEMLRGREQKSGKSIR